MKKQSTLKIIIGISLLPIALSLFFVDRCILTFLPHLDSMNMKKWFNDTQMMVNSFIRTCAVAFIYIIYKLIESRLNG